MNGLLIIDKPEGLTSHDVVSRVRRVLKTKRVGHTGTLDPFATGVMVILVGKATRLAQFLDKDEKEYEAVVSLGSETDTGDRTGVVRDAETLRRGDTVTADEIETVLDKFRGEIEQTPPMYSAKKIEGKKLYELARKGMEIERKPVKVTITKLELLSVPEAVATGEVSASGLTLKVACSAGTYIRTLAEDIGRELGTGAHLEELRRTRAGRFDISQSRTIAQLEQMPIPAAALLPVMDAVSHLPRFVLNADRVEKTRSGLSSRYDAELEENAAVRMVSDTDELIAVGFYNSVEKTVQPKVVLI